MSSPASNEERNRLRLQAWEQRNHESSQVKKQNFFDGHLFGQPYKTNKEDELSSRIQRMLGSYEDDSSAEPFSIPSSLTFPLSNRTPPVSESSSHLQVCYGYQGLKGTCAKSSSTPYSPDRRCEGDSFFRPSLQKSAARDDRDRPLYHTPSEDANANANMQSSPHNRTMAMSHSQAFHLPLSNKPPAMTQKPTAYVRPMDGQDLIWTESPELKPPSGPQTSLQELSRDKSVRGNANVSPSFLASKTSELQCVEEILREMTCSWPPLLSDIHSPRPHCAPKPQCSVKEISPLKQENVQAASIESSHSHPGLTVLSTETPSRAVDSVCSSDVESSKSASESECGADDPPVTAPIKHAAALGDWQLDKITDFRQQNYRSKTQWPNVQSPILSPVTDVPKQATVCIFSPLRDSPKLPRASGCHKRNIIQHCAKDEKPHKVSHSKTNVKEESGPKKKQKLQDPSPTPQTSQQEHSTTSDAKANKAKKNAEPHTSTLRESKKSKKCKTHKQHSSTAPESNKETKKCQNDSDQPQEKSGKTMQETTAQKPRQESSRNKPQPKCEKRKLPVKHYIKEAKRLKHKADAEMDKLHKTFHYLQAALFFIESGIAMEREPHTSLSSYTMFGETVELLKFVLRLTNSKDASPSENDLISLCLRCQALLQMAMFHLKQKPALAFSKTLIDHFNNSKSAADSIKGKTSAQSPHGAGASGSIVVPQDVGQVALTYVNITTLFLTAHDLWEQADEFVTKGSGLTVELDRTMGALSLSSTMSSMVSYVRQGLHRLQTSNPKP
uniref:AF4/FMR2 family member lilli n=1 Tax=Knipowitschia caucasica TaxID=637954 RepID=A0AAV2IR42_KNICA